MQIPASGSAVDTYLNETQNTDLPAVVNPGSGRARSARRPTGCCCRAWRGSLLFLIPLSSYSHVAPSPVSDNPDDGYYFAWNSTNYSEALSRYGEQFLRSFLYAGTATVLALVIAYPLAYFIAFRAGRWRR